MRPLNHRSRLKRPCDTQEREMYVLKFENDFHKWKTAFQKSLSSEIKYCSFSIIFCLYSYKSLLIIYYLSNSCERISAFKIQQITLAAFSLKTWYWLCGFNFLTAWDFALKMSIRGIHFDRKPCKKIVKLSLLAQLM